MLKNITKHSPIRQSASIVSVDLYHIECTSSRKYFVNLRGKFNENSGEPFWIQTMVELKEWCKMSHVFIY